MITSMIKTPQGLHIVEGLAEQDEQTSMLWLEINAPTAEESFALSERFGINTDRQFSSVNDTGKLLYLRTDLLALNAQDVPEFGRVSFILGDGIVATLCRKADFHPFSHAIKRLQRKTSHYNTATAVLRILLRVANDSADNVIDSITDALEQTSDKIFEISEGFSADGRELGVQDLLKIMRVLNEKEELISRCLEAQLSLARAVRYLNGEVDNITEVELQQLVDELAEDVAGVKEHAYFEHEKVRYLQNAVTNILNIKQNQIVKVFTIITAVFLPPTLVGTFYGMNFSVMPELAWKHGFMYSMILTVGAALLPLVYIKHKGWLR